MALHTDGSHAGMLNVTEITTYALSGTFVAFFIARQVMKAIVFRTVALDDLCIVLATALAIGLSVTTVLLTSKESGDLGFLTVERANTIMKGLFACELLYISSLCFSKLSIVVLFYNVVVSRTHRIFVMSFGICIFTWSLASTAAVAFQCSLPRPWETMTLRCFSTQIFWVVFCAIDISTEILLITLAVDMVAHLQVRVSRKSAVVACFAPRLLVVVAALIRVIFLYRVTPHGNPGYHFRIIAICTQGHVCASICTACIPYMVPFYKSLQGTIRRPHSMRGWTTTFTSSRPPGQSPNRLRKREAKVQFESPRSFASLIKEPVRVSIISPRLPTPGPISPLMPPLASTLRLLPTIAHAPESRRGRTPSVTGIVYDSDSDQLSEICSLETAMCFAASPIEPTAQAHILSAAAMDVSQSFEYLGSIGSPDPSSSSSCYSSRASNPTKSDQYQDLEISMLPRRTATHGSLHTSPQRDSLPVSPGQTEDIQPATPDEDLSRTLTWRTLSSPAIHLHCGDCTRPARSVSSRSHPKFSTTPHLHAPPPTMTSPANPSLSKR